MAKRFRYFALDEPLSRICVESARLGVVMTSGRVQVKTLVSYLAPHLLKSAVMVKIKSI